MLRRTVLVLMVIALTGDAGTNWTKLWLEPNPVKLRAGETLAYKVMGIHGPSLKTELTRSPYLTMASSDRSIFQIDRGEAVLKGEAPGHAELRLSFSELKSVVQVDVQEDPETK